MTKPALSPWPSFTVDEAKAVEQVLLSNRVNYWTGDECRQFEREFADWCGARHAVSLANGTLALEAALGAIGISAGDEVIVTPRSFIASASCVVSAGGTPVFADVDVDSGNISAKTIARVITPRTKAIVCVHLAGWPCDMDPIMALARDHQLKVIEDCAQANGARYRGRSVGTIGHIGAWSFCQDKIMTTGGEGGMVTTNDEQLWQAMWSLKDHGKSWQAVHRQDHPPGFKWLHESFGSNWRMLEMQAVIGRLQLRRLADWTNVRARHCLSIWEACRRHGGVRVPDFYPDEKAGEMTHAGYKCYVYVRPERLREGWSRDRLVEEINSRGIPCFQGSCSEIYLEKAFDNVPWSPKHRLQNAKALGETSLMFLVHPTLTPAEIQRTCDVIDQVFGLGLS